MRGLQVFLENGEEVVRGGLRIDRQVPVVQGGYWPAADPWSCDDDSGTGVLLADLVCALTMSPISTRGCHA